MFWLFDNEVLSNKNQTHHASNKIVSVDSMLLQQLSIIFCHTGVISNKKQMVWSTSITDDEAVNL